MTALTIAHVTIQQDEHGRYCLNDLHAAAGGAGHHRPSKWLATKQAQGLISALQAADQKAEFRPFHDPAQSPNSGFGNEHPKAGIPALGSGSPSPKSGLVYPIKTYKPETGKPSTYVVKELVYAYAMWISPVFNLKVIRAYDSLVRGELTHEQARRGLFEFWYFEKYPNDRVIRMLALRGEPYWYIGTVVKRTAATVGRAIRRMLTAGLMEARRLGIARAALPVLSAHRRQQQRQFSLNF